MAQSGTKEDFEALAKEVRYLRDRLEIQDCIHRYCRGLDRLDRELALSAYHADGSDDRGGPFVGSPQEFVDWVFPDLKNAKGTSHNISNISCEIVGDVAHAESYITFHVWSADDKNVIVGGARYVDRLERRSGRWAIAHREAIMDYMMRLEQAPMRGGGTMPEGKRDKTDRSYLRPLGLSEDAKRRRDERKRAG